MKLLYCARCHDVVALKYDTRSCECGHSSGHYLKDGRTVAITGNGNKVVGVDNRVFVTGEASAWIIREPNRWVVREDGDKS